MGIIALVTLGGCGLAGWILGQLFHVFAQVIDVLADGADAPGGRGPDRAAPGSDPGAYRSGPGRTRWIRRTAHRRSRQRVRAAVPGRSGASWPRPRRQAEQGGSSSSRLPTEHLRGEPLHALDRKLALWMLNLVERRVQAGTVDVELAGWVSRALDSFGPMPEAEPLRVALPALRQAGPVPEVRAACGRPGIPVYRVQARQRRDPSGTNFANRSSSTREHS